MYLCIVGSDGHAASFRQLIIRCEIRVANLEQLHFLFTADGSGLLTMPKNYFAVSPSSRRARLGVVAVTAVTIVRRLTCCSMPSLMEHTKSGTSFQSAM